MKKLLLIFGLFGILNYAQELNIPGAPCSPGISLSSSAQRPTSTAPSNPFVLKVLLVEFSDVKHNTSPAYTLQNFNDLFFSSGEYVSPNKYSPDGQQVFGSLHDYYYKMSNGNFSLSGSVINQDLNNDQIPDWITLDYTKAQYDNNTRDIFTDAIAKAQTAGLSIGTLGARTKLCIIYAGMTYRSTTLGLRPYCIGNEYIMGEKFAAFSPFDAERTDAKFSHIGLHAHEFGHCLGLPDTYYTNDNNGYWDLMAAGNYNGPSWAGECPAPLNSYLRYYLGWLSPQTVTTDESVVATYDLQNPVVYQVNSSSSTDYYLIECRNFNSSMTLGSTTCSDYNSNIPFIAADGITQGMVVWKVSTSTPYGRILHASNIDWGNNHYAETDVFPGKYNVNVLSPWSSTSTATWAPKTAPSTNVGMEIISAGSGYYNITLYAQSPANATPSKPQNLNVTTSNHSAILTWAPSLEPDVINGGIYKIYRVMTTGSDPASNSSYSLLTTINAYNSGVAVTSFTDEQFWMGSGTYRMYYEITAVDNTSKESTRSNSVWASTTGELWKKGINNLGKKAITVYNLCDNYPNPFNPSTVISYQLPKDSNVSLKIYNMLGQEIITLVKGNVEAGTHSVTFNASKLASGVYLYKLDAGCFSQIKKMILTK